MKRRKLIYLLCVLSLVLTNALYVNYELIVTLILTLLIPIISWIIFLVVNIGLRVHLYTEYLQIHKSENIKLIINILNACPVPVSRGRLEVHLKYSQCSKSEDMIVPISISKGDKEEEPLVIKPEHSGTLEITMGHYMWSDYTGIFESARKLKGTMNIVVMPDLLIQNQNLRDKNNKVKMEKDIIKQPDMSEIRDVRLYEPGDPLNRIHWKLSLKTDELMVKEFEEVIPKDNAIIVDLTLGQDEDFRDELDKIYQFAYSYGHFLLNRKCAYEFIVWNDELNMIEEIEFSNETSLVQAIKRIMMISCSKNAMRKLDQEIEKNEWEFTDPTVLITAQQYKSELFYSINVTEHDIQQQLNEICN